MTTAGGRDPPDWHVTSDFLPADIGRLVLVIRTSNGRTVYIMCEENDIGNEKRYDDTKKLY